VRELFSRFVAPIIDKVLGIRCTSYGYQYSEIVGSLASVYFCGGDCVEDVTSHLMPHLSLHPTLRTCSSDTILRGISELATANTTYTSDTGKNYDFNTATKLNGIKGISKTKPRMRHLINVKEPHFLCFRACGNRFSVAKGGHNSVFVTK
jgi:hypothetical protein